MIILVMENVVDGPRKMAKQGNEDLYTRGRRVNNTIMFSVSLAPVGKYQN